MFSSVKKKPPVTVSKGTSEDPQLSSPPLSSIYNTSQNGHGFGTPAPWSSRLSVLARFTTSGETKKVDGNNQIQPVYVGEFPQIVRRAQANAINKSIYGGIDRETSVAWMICGDELFVWDLFFPSDKHCTVLEIPSPILNNRSTDTDTKISVTCLWSVCIICWDSASTQNQMSKAFLEKWNSIGIVLCDRRSQAIVYWPEIVSVGKFPIVDLLNPLGPSRNDRFAVEKHFSSIIAAAIPGIHREGIALACESSGTLWLLEFSKAGLTRRKAREELSSNLSDPSQYSCTTSALVWQPCQDISSLSECNFFLLTNHAIQCWTVSIGTTKEARRVWSHSIIGSDSDLGIKRDIAGQKHIWLLDLQVDDHGKEFSILVATLCKDRISGSNYMQYSLLTMQYGIDQISDNSGEKNVKLEKKASPQVIIPKAKVENEEFLSSMRLRSGGKPSGSVVVLAGDGTATVAVHWRGSTRLYQFCLPWDAGKVLDASTCHSNGIWEGGAWIVLTEKAGVWAIPEKAILAGGVEPPERSLSRRDSYNAAASEEKRRQTDSSALLHHSESDSKSVEEKIVTEGPKTGEESENLLGRLFDEFLLSGTSEGVLHKVGPGAFENEAEMNIFVHMSKYVVNSLAKHWTTRNANFVASSIGSSLSEKQEKHEKYLQFLALSKCHYQLSIKQRSAVLIIMEHGEKLSGMMKLKEFQSLLSQQQSSIHESANVLLQGQGSDSLWNLIQLVGEKARRSNVLLMDRENTEVFFSKVSDVEDLFDCLSNHLSSIFTQGPLFLQMQQAIVIVNACVTFIEAAVKYRDEHNDWYPSLDGLISWNSQPVVRSGLWSVASFTMKLLKEDIALDTRMLSELLCQLQRLTDALLNAYACLLTAKSLQGEVYNKLLDEYCRRRDELLESWYEFAKKVAESDFQDASRGADIPGLKEDIYRKVLNPVLNMAQRYEGHQTLWHLCVDFGGTSLLSNLMVNNASPQGFRSFVLKQLFKNSQYAKLLRLGEEIPEELECLLKDRKDLLWLHEIYMNQYSAASDTLHSIAVCTSDTNIDFDEPKFVQYASVTSLVEQKRLLYLAKIAAVAGEELNAKMNVGQIEADIQLLTVQEKIVGAFPDNNERKELMQLYPPTELIKVCLKGGRDLSLKAFEVFAWTNSSFRRSNKSLLVDCWRHAAEQDDWSALWQASTTEGRIDEFILESLKRTVIFSASEQCYGPEAEVHDGRFEDILPLRRMQSQFDAVSHVPLSVEDVLMQHKDFPDAGKLMIGALMMGKGSSTTYYPDHDMAI